MIFVHLGLSWASGLLFLRRERRIDGIRWRAATDVIIAVSLAWIFWRMMCQSSPERETRSLLRRILILAICSGAICATNTVLMAVFLLNGSLGTRVRANDIGKLLGRHTAATSKRDARYARQLQHRRVPRSDDALPPKPPRAIQDGGWFATGDLALYEVSKFVRV
ncbi:hypothetical protein B0H14DRAFT_3002085 [Mycena olivaceomarginata]|nr:hypothetical protein B0H14DRAFT_3002085 [Mycena olivaceomarginata]